MKKLVLSLAVMGAFFASCSSDDDNNTTPTPTEPGFAVLEGDIAANRTLSADTTYTLRGPVYVNPGVTLTIPAGTVFEADVTHDEVAFLAVEMGGKIIANGTAEAPIVFTSGSANPEPGDWGGLVICGKSVTNLGTNVQAEVTGLTYGGTDLADNSGVYRHIIVEYSGNLINDEAEFNGVTFYAVGTGTVVENILVFQGSDDGFEWFGGSVNGSNLAAIGCQDDSFDWTEGWNGTVTNVYSNQSTATAASSDSRGIEADNNNGNNELAPISHPTLNNVTLVGRNSATAIDKEAGACLRRGTFATITNLYIADFKSTAADSGRGISFESTASQTFFTENPLNTVTISNVTTESNLPAGYVAAPNASGAGAGADYAPWMSWMGL